MGNCKYCGESAGWFKDQHPMCFVRYEAAWEELITTAAEAVQDSAKLDGLQEHLSSLAMSSYHPPSHVRESLIKGWGRSLNRALDDNLLSPEEEERLMEFAERFELSQRELDADGAFTRAAMAASLRDLLDGKVPTRVKVTGQLPFNVLSSEYLVWLFKNVSYCEERIHRTYVGGYQGISVKVTNGVYYRMGGFKGKPIGTESLDLVDHGLLGITTKHLYFSGTKKSFRIPYGKIVTFIPYSDGLEICKENVSAKPQVFITGEGWFIYNLVSNLSKDNIRLTPPA